MRRKHAHKRKYKANLSQGSRSGFINSQLKKGRSQKQAAASWRMLSALASKKRAKKPRSYGKGRYHALTARVGAKRGKRLKTFLYKTPKGKVRHIPTFGMLGYRSRAEWRRLTSQGGARGARARSASWKRVQKLEARRARIADQVSKRIRQGRFPLTPNRGGTQVFTFREWKMKRKKKRHGKRRHYAANFSKAQRRAALKNLIKARAARRKGHKGHAKKRHAKKRTVRRTSSKRRVAMRNLKKACRVVSRYRGNSAIVTQAAANGRTRKRHHKQTRAQRLASLRNLRKARAASHHGHKRHAYRRNASIGLPMVSARQDYVDTLLTSLKGGLVILAGYAGHRAISKLLDDQALSKLSFLQGGTIGDWRPTITSALVAGAEILFAAKFAPREYAAPLIGGAAVSFLHGLLMKGLGMAGGQTAASYLGAYPDAQGNPFYGSGMRGVGSYYTVQPGQTYPNGMGEYYEMSPSGQPLRMNQLTQAASGMGLYTNQLTQAAAGMGQAPIVTQAAAGEYLVYGAEGVGADYEEVGAYPSRGSVYDGIRPNLTSAEQALDVMEAAAGVGATDIPYQDTINPSMMTASIPDHPGGERSGILGTQDGIFGGSAMS